MSSSETLKAANRKLSAEWDLLPPEAKSIYKEKAQFYAAQMEEVQQARQTADLTSSRAAASNRRPAYYRISS